MRRRVPSWFDGPLRLVAVVGIVVGLLFVFVTPPWSGGADEATHFARSLSMADGRLMPHKIDGKLISQIPESYRADENLVIANFFGPAFINGTMMRSLLRSTPNWENTFDYDTGATTAASPVAYLPSAIGMWVPNLLEAPGVVVLWFGRLANLFLYLLVIGLALRIAVAFRWTIALGAIIPMNLALASAVSPDGLTVASIALVVAVFTRVWAEAVNGDGEVVRSRDVNRVTVAMVLGSGLLLAVSKPPYFLVLSLFGVLAIVARRNRTALAAGCAALAAIAVGGLSVVVAASSNYGGVAESISDPITVQPDVQKQRLLHDPIGFLRHCATDWFSRLNETVQGWSRRLGIWTSDPPRFLPWLLIASFVVAAVLYDLEWFRRFGGWLRWSVGAGVVALVVSIYASAFIWFDDTTWGKHMGDQIARYTVPLFALALIGWVPRWTFSPIEKVFAGRISRTVASRTALAVALISLTTAVVAAVINWVSTGRM
jgi:uncharacterized membrane protein